MADVALGIFYAAAFFGWVKFVVEAVRWVEQIDCIAAAVSDGRPIVPELKQTGKASWGIKQRR